jgi:hypothetical protein
MDLSKYPVDKLFHIAAGIIPGFIALTIFDVAHPNAFEWFFALGSLGYKTTAAIILFASFVVGFTFTTFLNAVMGAIGGIVGQYRAQQPYQPAHSFAVAPWRDHLWRTALEKAHGKDAPDDTLLVSEQAFNARREIINSVPVELAQIGPLASYQQQALADLAQEKLASEINDGKWRDWYDHYHRIVLQRYGRDFVFHIRTGLNFNLEAAGLYVLVSAIFVPGIRHWWSLLPAIVWVLMGIAEVLYTVRRFPDRWSTLFEQIDYLSKGQLDGEAK